MESVYINVGYLGPKGTFSEQAALEFTQENKKYKLRDFPTIPHVLKALENGQIELGIVPVENSIEGTVNITLDMLVHDVELYIQGELVLDIKHCLISNYGKTDEIHTIYSHPQALAQCRRFLSSYFPQARYITTNSTAEGALFVKKGTKGLAAITSLWAAEKYGLEIIAENVSDYEENQTRFLIIGRQQLALARPNKTSLCVALPKEEPGGLYEILGLFVEDQINLSKIESRPAKKELGNYIFFIDCLADLLTDKRHVLEKLQKKCKLVKVLGCYARF